MSVEARLRELGLQLPSPATPVANYVPAVRTGNLVFLSGHGPVKEDGTLVRGRHARSAVGMNGLPFNIAVEIEMVAEVED